MNEVRYGDPMAKKAHERQQKELEKQQKKLNVMQGVDKKLAEKHGFEVPKKFQSTRGGTKQLRLKGIIRSTRKTLGRRRSRHRFREEMAAEERTWKHLEIEKRGTRNLTDTVYMKTTSTRI